MEKTYKQKLTEATARLVVEHDFFIIGQRATDGGHGMFATDDRELMEKCIELPVFEKPRRVLL